MPHLVSLIPRIINPDHLDELQFASGEVGPLSDAVYNDHTLVFKLPIYHHISGRNSESVRLTDDWAVPIATTQQIETHRAACPRVVSANQSSVFTMQENGEIPVR